MKKIVFLASGNGGNMKFIHQAQKKKLISFDVKLYIVSDRGCGSLAYAKENDIENYQINYDRKNPSELQSVLKGIIPDIIVSNWHKIIDEDTVTQYKGKIINLHYSLLPAFAGLIGVKPIEMAYNQGCQYVGATCHEVDKGVDTGKILSQMIVKTNVPIYEAIESVFRGGCLILLNTMMDSNEGVLKEDTSFSPNLNFDKRMFNDMFWKELGNL